MRQLALLLMMAASLLPATHATLSVTADTDAATWPHSVQPFFLSALNAELTAADAAYLGRLPVVVINHKQRGPANHAEANQLNALARVKEANSSCTTFFYLNSQIDFGALALHGEFVANGSWWLRTDAGAFVLHGSDHIFDWSVPAARSAWLAAAQHAMSQPFVSGVFVDKAGGFGAKGVRTQRLRAWTRGHAQLLDALGAAAAAAKKQLIFNNNGIAGMSGQLFERWGAKEDHDGLSTQQDLELLENATSPSNAGQLQLARAGGVAPGSVNGSIAEVCAAGLAAMLLAVASPNSAYFACMPDFNVIHGWMDLDKNMIYQQYLGAPQGKAVVGDNGLITRTFAGAKVSLNVSAFVQTRNPTDAGLNRGCIEWASGETSGVCPSAE